MKKAFLTQFLFLLFLCATGQTLSEIQMRNARATGFAIVASRNPGADFSVLMIPWDGVNSLEYNANTQINGNWHAQAAVKGNYFDQTFNGSDFSKYSSVVLSQAGFDQYRGTGTQWWIVCSTLPPFSDTRKNMSELLVSGNGVVDGKFGIGTPSPASSLEINGKIGSANGKNFRLYYGGGGALEGAELSGLAHLPALAGGNGWTALYAKQGSAAKAAVLDGDVLVYGNLKAKEIKVTLSAFPDFVFKEDYPLLSLEELEKFIQKNHHLPEIPSERQVIEEGLNLGEMDAKLLQKIEELTLYTIQQEKPSWRSRLHEKKCWQYKTMPY